jgi:hypothetical protein
MDIEVTYENGRYYADRDCPICGGLPLPFFSLYQIFS